MAGDALQVTVGNNLRAIRHNAGLTQELLAERAELDKSYIGMLERGEKAPSLEVIGKLAACLSVPPGIFFSAGESEEDECVQRVVLATRQLAGQGCVEIVEKVADLLEQVLKTT